MIASQPQELADAQLAIIESVKRKEQSADQDINSACVLLKQCDENHISSAHAKRLRNRAVKRKTFLSKMREALEAGYVIVPNFPGSTIAVRVSKKKPNPKKYDSAWSNEGVPSVKPDELPVGGGRYVDNEPFVLRRSYMKKQSDGTEKERHLVWASSFDENLSLPVEFLKPTIVQMTGKAMAKKLFDEIVVVDGTTSATARKTDPLVIGRIIDKENNKQMSFLIAWFVDTVTF